MVRLYLNTHPGAHDPIHTLIHTLMHIHSLHMEGNGCESIKHRSNRVAFTRRNDLECYVGMSQVGDWPMLELTGKAFNMHLFLSISRWRLESPNLVLAWCLCRRGGEKTWPPQKASSGEGRIQELVDHISLRQAPGMPLWAIIEFPQGLGSALRMLQQLHLKHWIWWSGQSLGTVLSSSHGQVSNPTSPFFWANLSLHSSLLSRSPSCSSPACSSGKRTVKVNQVRNTSIKA